MIQQCLRDILVSVRHSPHKRGPLVSVLHIDRRTSIQQSKHNLLVSEAACVHDRRSPLSVHGIYLNQLRSRTSNKSLYSLRIAIASSHEQEVLQRLRFLVTRHLVVTENVLLSGFSSIFPISLVGLQI